MGCDCAKLVQSKLDERNTLLIIARVNGDDRVALWTEVKEARRRSKPMRVFSKYCPFCGVSYTPPTETIAQREKEG